MEKAQGERVSKKNIKISGIMEQINENSCDEDL